MKKVVAIFFLFIYSFTTVGATIHTHYCMNKLVSASLYHGKEVEKCEKCGMHKSAAKSCCKDEHTYIKLKREHQKTQPALNLSFANVPIILPSSYIYNQVRATSIVKSCIPSHEPPNIQGQKIHILNCVYLI